MLAIRTLLNAGMKVEVSMASLEILLQRHGFKQVDGKWYLCVAISSPSGSEQRWA